MLGEAGKVIVNSFSTTIIDGSGSNEDIEVRVADLREQYKKAESLIDKEEIKKRLSALTGKVAIVRVGAPTEIDRGDIQLRVEDAIAATQSAIRDGVVPGGGVCLARLAPETFTDAYRALFETLVVNAGYNPKEALYKILEAPTWYGYDLRNYTTEPIDLLKQGIIDPAEVIKETVRNACSVVSKLLTAEVGIVFQDRESKAD
jgi:chaperonin GroEL